MRKEKTVYFCWHEAEPFILLYCIYFTYFEIKDSSTFWTVINLNYNQFLILGSLIGIFRKKSSF